MTLCGDTLGTVGGRVARPTLSVGLLNNASARAAKATGQRFWHLLRRAGTEWTVIVTMFSPNGAEDHLPADALFQAELDALIVTGAEPTSGRLQDEECWPLLARVADWAALRALPTIWSCLAAHAAVLHLDGVERRRLPTKLSGLQACSLVGSDHPCAEGLPRQWHAPHSRFNDLAEADLRRAGHVIVSRLENGCVDLFTRHDVPFVFVQGHPEYASRDLLLEYKRDVRRFLTGESAFYPAIPTGCVDRANAETLAEREILAAGAVGDQSFLLEMLDLLDAIPSPLERWRPVADRLFANWLRCAALSAVISTKPGCNITADRAALV